MDRLDLGYLRAALQLCREEGVLIAKFGGMEFVFSEHTESGSVDSDVETPVDDRGDHEKLREMLKFRGEK